MDNNTICHIEWDVTDFEKVKSFYGGLFGWEFNAFGDTYMVFQPTSGPGGGFSKVETVTPSKTPTVYINVDDLDAYINKAKDLGGTADGHIHEVPGMGWLTYIQDLDGNNIGLWKAAQG